MEKINLGEQTSKHTNTLEGPSLEMVRQLMVARDLTRDRQRSNSHDSTDEDLESGPDADLGLRRIQRSRAVYSRIGGHLVRIN